MPGPSESFDTAAAILQTCEDMLDEYEQLAESGAGILSDITGAIGLYYQYEYHYSGGNPYFESTEYHDRDIRWYEKWIAWSNGWQVGTERVPHPRRQEALDALAATQGDIEDADEKFDYDARDIRDTVSSIAEYMASWVDCATDLSLLPFPEVPQDVPTSGDATGWRSPNAFSIYERNMSLQYEAHVTTEETIVDTLSRCAQFLSELSTYLAEFATLVRDQEQYYTDLATSDWIPDKVDIGWVIDSINSVGTAVIEFRRQQDSQAKAMIDVMNGAVESILAIHALTLKINGMSRSGEPGWPTPNHMGGRTEEGGSSLDELEFQVQYFKDHIAHWQRLSDSLAPIATAGEATPEIARMFYRWPSFAASTATALNDLSGVIAEKALRRGATATQQISDILDTSIRNYIEGENINTAEAQRLQEMLDS